MHCNALQCDDELARDMHCMRCMVCDANAHLPRFLDPFGERARVVNGSSAKKIQKMKENTRLGTRCRFVASGLGLVANFIWDLEKEDKKDLLQVVNIHMYIHVDVYVYICVYVCMHANT